MGPSGQCGAQRYIVSFRHSANLFHFRDSSRVGKVRLDDIHAARLEQPLEIPSGVEPFPCRNGNVAEAAISLKSSIFSQSTASSINIKSYSWTFCQDFCHGFYVHVP